MPSEIREALLHGLSFGAGVAEFENDLSSYFLRTPTFNRLVHDEVDIVGGEKGSGKTALFKYISENPGSIDALDDVVVLPGFNPTGNPVFQQLAATPPLNEGQYVTVWKAYILSLVATWAIEFFADDPSPPEEISRLSELLVLLDLKAETGEPESVFSRISGWLKRLVTPDSISVEARLDQFGFPVLSSSLHLTDDARDTLPQGSTEEGGKRVSHEEALGLLDSVVESLGVKAWVVLDRLDEAFVGYSEVETPALRALFRTYLDLLAFKNMRLKIFIRRDLFSKITIDPFVNLTHVNARRAEITWDEDDLFALLCRRIGRNSDFLRTVEDTGQPVTTKEDIFYALLPRHVEANKRQTTWQWMLSKTRDGKRSIQPRNLIDLLSFAKNEEIGRQHHSPYHKLLPLITQRSILKAFDSLSDKRVGDTIIAEVGKEVVACINGLRDGKAEHNQETLADAFGLAKEDVLPLIEVLVEFGFLEHRDGTYKVPILYRKGLNIKMGKAF